MSAPTLQPAAVTAVPTDVQLPARSSSLRATGRLVQLLAPATIADRPSWTLPVVAQAVVSALTLTVAGGVRYFFTIEGEMGSFYRIMSCTALVLLVIPLMTLAGAAARLSATRRDTRLSSLRLLGATGATVRLLTLVESAAVSLVGGLVGVVGYLALVPLVGLLHFNGEAIGAGRLWLGVLPVLVALLLIMVLAVVSSAIGLRRVVISPLGVRTRQQAPRAGAVRAVLAAAAVVAASAATKLLGTTASEVVGLTIGATMLCLPLLAFNLVGPWLVSVVARGDLRRASSPVQLLAARSVLEDPKQVWRQAGPLGVTTFVGVFTGMGLALVGQMPSDGADAIVAADIRTGVLLTLAISFVTVACAVGINQTAAVLDRRALHVGLDMVGMPRELIDRARRRAVMRPLLAIVLVAAGAAGALVVPLGLASTAVDPVAVAVVVGVLVLGLVVVRAALWSSSFALRQVLRVGLVRSE